MPRKATTAASLSEDELRPLASFTAPDPAVISLYLDTDGRRFPRKGDYELHLADLLRGVRTTQGLGREARASLGRDISRVERFVRTEFDRGDTRGLAIFACDAGGLWRVFRLPKTVRNRVIVDRHPHVLRLEALLASSERFATVLVDREKARLFSTSLGETAERTEILDEVPGRHGQGGWAQARYQRHIEELMHRHLKHVAEVLFALLKREPFDRLVLAGPEPVVAEFEKGLHPWLAERVTARINLPLNASRPRVREATLAVEEVVEAERVAEAVTRILEEFAAKRSAVVGLRDTLAALHDGRVEVLVVADGEVSPGWRCTGCGALGLEEGKCPSCGASTVTVADLAEELVDEALRRRCTVLTAPAGALPNGAGALLRF